MVRECRMGGGLVNRGARKGNWGDWGEQGFLLGFRMQMKFVMETDLMGAAAAGLIGSWSVGVWNGVRA